MPELMPRGEQSLAQLATPQAHELERLMRADSAGVIRLVLTEYDSRGYYVASALMTLDRELRRSSRRVRSGERLAIEAAEPTFQAAPEVRAGRPSYPTLPEDASDPGVVSTYRARGGAIPPDHPDRASLVLLAAAPGSAHLLLQPVGEMLNLLTTQGVTAIVNAMALLGPVRRVAAFFNRAMSWSLNDLLNPQTLTTATSGTPNMTINLGNLVLGYPGRPRRMTILDLKSDGSATLVVIDGEDPQQPE